jgi:hypothetical protein
MQPNKTILIGGVVILSVGVVNAAVNNRPETPVFAGAVGVLLLASLLDAIGPGPGKIATALIALTTVTVLIVEGPAVFSAIQNAQKGK